MTIVAVAGGTGFVGRTLVQALLDFGKHKVFVLSRTSTPDDPQRLAIDYEDSSQIASVLRTHGVEAVVSAVVLLDDQVARAQKNLIRGAAESGTVDRFLPSEWHLDFYKPIRGIELAFKERQLSAVAELETFPQLTFSLVRNGLFLEYLGMPFHARPTNMMTWNIFVDLSHELCVFPGDGAMTIILTHSRDMAAMIARLLNLPASKWPRESLVCGNRIRLNEIARVIKEITGKDFTVVYDSPEDVLAGRITQLPMNRELFADKEWGPVYRVVEKEAMVVLLNDGYDLGGTNLADLFPDVPLTDITEFLSDSWRLREEEFAKRKQ